MRRRHRPQKRGGSSARARAQLSWFAVPAGRPQ